MNTLVKPKTETQSRALTITGRDKRHLERMIDQIKQSGKKEEMLESLVNELKQATIVDSEAVSPKVVTMNSLVSVVDLETFERLQYKLVYPDQDNGSNTVSILSSIGLGMLGHQVGDEVELKKSTGSNRVRIARVDYQPDAANTYRL